MTTCSLSPDHLICQYLCILQHREKFIRWYWRQGEFLNIPERHMYVSSTGRKCGGEDWEWPGPSTAIYLFGDLGPVPSKVH